MANILFVLVFTGLIFECFSTEHQVRPGIRLRVTTKGLQYADDVGIKVLSKRLRRDRLDDISHKSGNLEYRFYGIRNKRASIGFSSFTTAPGEGLTLRASGIDLDFSGSLSFKKKFGWFKFSDTVGFTFKAHGIEFSLTVRIGASSDGRPTISAQKRDCSSQVHSVNVRFIGGKSWLYNLFSDEIDSKVKDQLKKLICKEAREAINEDGAEFLATFPVLRNVSSVAQIDYSLVEDPTFNSSYMDVPLKGEFKPVGDHRATLALFVPAPLPPLRKMDKMVYIWLTDYVFNTASFVYHQQRALRTVIKPNDLPRNSKFLLNTKACKHIFRQLYERYRDRPMFVKLYTTKAPVFTTRTNMTSVTVNGNAEIHVIAKNGLPIYALTLGLKFVLTGSVGVKYGNLSFHAESFTSQVRLVRSAIGNIRSNVMLLQTFINLLIKSGHFVDKLNVLGGRGLPLPMLRHVIWEDTSLTTGEGFTLIETNLKYRSKR